MHQSRKPRPYVRRKHSCRLPTCNSSSDVNPELKFYSFPTLGDIQLKWLEAVGVPEWRSLEWDELKRLQLCSLHFDETSVTEFGHLYPTSVPSLHLFPCTDDSSRQEESVPCPPIKTTPVSDGKTPRCDNCGYLMFSGTCELPDTWRQESKGIQIMPNHSADSDLLTSLRSLKPEALELSIPALLNSILKLPSPNRLTKDIRLCAVCVPVLGKILALFNLLQKMSTANSVLNSVFTDLEEMLHLLVQDNRASQLQLERLKNQKEVGDKDKIQDSSTESATVVQPPAASAAFPGFEAPIIVNSCSISVASCFIQPREDDAAQDIIPRLSEQFEEAMEEDPLADTPSAAPVLRPPKLKTEKAKKPPRLRPYFNRLQTKQLHFKKLAEQERNEQERKRKAKEARRRKGYKNRLHYAHPPCPHCGRIFKPSHDKHALEKHISVRHTFSSKITCDICARPFHAPDTVRRHRLTHMNEEERSNSQAWSCPECGKMFRSDGNLKQHLVTHKDVKSRLLRCPEQNCDYTTMLPQVLRNHARVHDPTAEAPFKCTKCGAAFKFKTHFKYHEMKDCAPPDRIHACVLPGCGKRFKVKPGLVLHYTSRFHNLSAEEAREKVYPGLHCPDWVEATGALVQPPEASAAFPGFQAPAIIQSGSISVTSGFIQPREEEPMTEDPLADTLPAAPLLPTKLKAEVKKLPRFYFKSLQAKRLHFKKVAKAEQERKEEEGSRSRRRVTRLHVHPPCPHCGRVLKPSHDKNVLEKHISVRHTFSSKFTCDICSRPFRAPKDVRKHKLTHMSQEERERSNSGSQPLFCPECGKMLRSDGCLKKHLVTHVDVESRLLRCPEQNCDYTTLLPETLRKHARLHDPTVETPFKCTKCGAAFQIMKHLQYHLMQDCGSPDRIHVCELPGCRKRFKLKHGLFLHYMSRFHRLSAEEAREKVYPGLPCPDWVEAQIKKKRKR